MKIRRGAVTHAPSTAGPGVPRTGFNFVEEAFLRRQRERLSNKIVVGSSVLVWALLVWLGYSSGAATSSNRTETAAATQKVTVVNQQLGQELGGVTDLPGHLQARREEIDAALSIDMSTSTMISDLFATAPPDLRIVSMSVSAPGAPAEQLANTGTTTTLPGAKPVVAPTAATLNVLGEGTTYATATAWRDAVRGLPYLKGVSVDYNESQSTSAIQLSLSALVDMSSLQQRRFAAATELGFKPFERVVPKTTTTTTTAPQGQK